MHAKKLRDQMNCDDEDLRRRTGFSSHNSMRGGTGKGDRGLRIEDIEVTKTDLMEKNKR
jgi:hypothetical protein